MREDAHESSAADLVEARALASPTPLLLVAVGCALFAAVFWHPRAYAMAAILGFLLLIGVIWPLISTRACRIVASPVQRRGRVGTPTKIRLAVQGAGWLPLRGLAFQPSDQANWSAKRPGALASLPARGERTLDWTVTPTCRGRFPSGAIEVSCSAPFRALTSHAQRPVQGQALIWPEVIELSPAGRPTTSKGKQEALRLVAAGGADGEISGPRPYRPGESTKRIHWPQSIRRSELIVCDREVEEGSSVGVELRLAPLDQTTPAATEAAVAIAASLATACAGLPGGVTVRTSAGRVFPGGEGAALAPLMDHLAMITPAAESNPSDGFRRGAEQPERSIVITTWIEHANVGDPEQATIVVIDRDSPRECAIGTGDRILSAAGWREELPQIWETLL